MIKIEMIGNLGADAELKQNDRGNYVTFSLYHTERWLDRTTGEVVSQTTRASVSYNGDLGELMNYMKTGFRVFVRGDVQLRTYLGNDHAYHAGLNIRAREIEPIFEKKETEQPQPDSQLKKQIKKLQG